MAIRFYFSFRSPYSWVAAHRLKQHFGDDFRHIDLVPFWEPDRELRSRLAEDGYDFLYRPMSRERHLYILQDIKRLARDLGLRMRWPVDPPQPWWEPPHLAYLVAERLGRGEDFLWATYRARWEEGRDICNEATLASLARSVDIDSAAIVAAPVEPAIRDMGAAALASAVRDMAFGVPFFVAGRDRYWGQDRVATLLADGHRPNRATIRPAATIEATISRAA